MQAPSHFDPPQKTAVAPNTASRHDGNARGAECPECGAFFGLYGTNAPKRPKREFCCDACKRAFNSRISKRGALLYSLFMTLRYERGLAKQLKVFAAMSRLAAGFRAEDKRERAGRRSWRRAGGILKDHPYLTAISTRIRGGR